MRERETATGEPLPEALDRAEAMAQQGQWEEAEALLLDLHGRFPDFADICNRMGYLYHQRGELALARDFLEKAVRLNPDYTEASLNLALTCNEQGDYQRAEEVVGRAQDRTRHHHPSLDPFVAGKLANKHRELGDIYRALGMLSDAADQFSKALALAPSFTDIQVRLGVTLREMGALDEAVEALARAAERRPDFPDARIQLGITWFSKGFVDRAVEEWKETLRRNPGNPKAAMYLSFVREEGRPTGPAPADRASGPGCKGERP